MAKPPKARLTVREDRRKWDQLKERLLEVAGRHVKVGVLGAPRSGGDVSNVELAAIHEFGAPSVGIPERRPLRAGLEKGEDARRTLTRRLAQGLYDGKVGPKQALSLLGMQAVQAIKSNILTGPGLYPPNSPATLARKRALGRGRGEPRVLVDTGQLVNSYSYVVEAS